MIINYIIIIVVISLLFSALITASRFMVDPNISPPSIYQQDVPTVTDIEQQPQPQEPQSQYQQQFEQQYEPQYEPQQQYQPYKQPYQQRPYQSYKSSMLEPLGPNPLYIRQGKPMVYAPYLVTVTDLFSLPSCYPGEKYPTAQAVWLNQNQIRDY